MSNSGNKITSLNAYKLTTYDLRQELVRRNCLDIPDEQVNHRSMLARLMKELVEDEAKETEQHTTVVVEEAASAREIAKQLREEKKREALERSKQRQADPDYFKRRTEENEAAKLKTEEGKSLEPVEKDPFAEDDDSDEEKVEDDPFRTTKAKRNKIFVK